jgi:hypothetical protein
MTFEEFNRIQAEAAARGQAVEICAPIEDLPSGLIDRLAGHLFPWAFPSAETDPLVIGPCDRTIEPEVEAEP